MMNSKLLKTSITSLMVVIFIVSCITGCNEEENFIPNDLEEVTSLSFRYGSGEIIPGRYIVVFRDGMMKEAARLGKDYNLRRGFSKQQAIRILDERSINYDNIDAAYGTAIAGFSIKIEDEDQLSKLESHPDVAYLEPDRIIALAPPPGKGPGGGGGGGSDPVQTVPWGISRVGGSVSAGNNTAWIIDSGIDLNHPDLNVDVNRSRTFVTQGKDADSPEDNFGHGTHVAGTIGAIDNNIGVVGVAAGAKVVAVKVLDRRGSGRLSWVIAGVDYVAASAGNGDVANMSLGGGVSSSLDQAVLTAAQSGVIFTLAAGNESDDADNHSPARVNHPNIYTISAMSQGDNWASFSNYGNPPVDYCAPGVSVLSTYKNGGYATASGTSMAAPHAAGVLLLGPPSSDGVVNGDPDGTPDPIITH